MLRTRSVFQPGVASYEKAEGKTLTPEAKGGPQECTTGDPSRFTLALPKELAFGCLPRP